MPLPMVHIAVAREIARTSGRIRDRGAFYLGAISPDAVHMRPGFSSQDKADAHFCAKWSSALDPEVWRKAAVGALQARHEDDFSVGYAVHVLTDVCWAETMFEKIYGAYDADPAPVLSQREAYYNDTDLLDIALYRESAWRGQAWADLASVRPRAYGALVSPEEVDAWRRRTVAWYDAHDPSQYAAMRYATRDALERFMADAAREIGDTLEKLLWADQRGERI